ncbi:MAG: Kelch repeat-containing protein, partial [Candidatus Saccharimonadales bacterium]
FSTCTSGGNEYQDIQYATISTSPGATSSYSSTSTGANSAGAGVYDTQANARSWPSVVAYGGYMYIVGGFAVTPATYLSTILYTPINSDGSLGTWKTTTKNLNVGRSGAGIAITNGYMYVTGGMTTGNTYLNDTEYAPITSSGDITTAFTDDTTHVFTTARQFPGAAVYNGYLYVVGGRYSNNTTSLGDLQYTPLNATTGAIGNWTATTQSLPTPEALAAVTTNSGYIYVIGGDKASSSDNTVYFSKFDSSGDITTAFGSAPTLPTGRYGAGASVSNGFIYVVSGNGGSELTDSLYAAICTGQNVTTQFSTNCSGASTPGTTTSWNSGPTLSNVGHGLGAVTYNGYIYTVGGCQSQGILSFQCASSANTYNNVQYAQIYNNGGGADGTWNAGGSISSGRFDPGSIAVNGFLYVMGGCINYSLVLGCTNITSATTQAPINSDGSLGTWTTGTALPESLWGFNTVATGGYVYLIGGCNAATCGYITTVRSALLCTGTNNGVAGCGVTAGTFGTWNNSLPALGTARFGPASTVSNGYLYVTGGSNNVGTSAFNDVQSAQILPSGGLGSWNSVGSGSTFTTARFGHSVVAYGNYLYLMGGANGAASIWYSDVQMAQVQANGQLGTWQSTASMPVPTAGAVVGGANGYLYVYSTRSASATWTNQLMYAPVLSNGTLGSWAITPGYAAVSSLTGGGGAIYNGNVYIAAGMDTSFSMPARSGYAPL